MARITGGSATYEQKVNTGNYEHKLFRSEISWLANEGDDARDMMDHAADEAVRITRERLGLAQKPVHNAAEIAAEVVRTREGLDPIDQLRAKAEAAGLPVEEADVELVEGKPMPKRTRAPKLGSVEALKAAAAAAAVDPLADDKPVLDLTADMVVDDDPFASIAPDITDTDMIKAAEAKKAELKDAVSIRKLIGTYAPQMAAIPQSRRAAFLAELKALAK